MLLPDTVLLSDCCLQSLLMILILSLRYESSSLKLYKELSSSIFQSLRVTLPDLHFVQYIKA